MFEAVDFDSGEILCHTSLRDLWRVIRRTIRSEMQNGWPGACSLYQLRKSGLHLFTVMALRDSLYILRGSNKYLIYKMEF